MTSGTPFPSHLTEIDELAYSDHYYLETGDKCYFLGEYTARKGFTFSETNRLVLNLKKPMDRRNKLEWKYKEKAIKEAGAAFGKAIPTEWLDRAVFVPIPPSRASSSNFGIFLLNPPFLKGLISLVTGRD